MDRTDLVNLAGSPAPASRSQFVTLNVGSAAPDPAAALDQVLAAYLKTLASRPHTLRAYGRHLRNAFRDLPAAALEDLAPWRLEAWRETLLQDGRSPATHAQVMSALRSFLDWVSAQLDRDLPRARMLGLPPLRDPQGPGPPGEDGGHRQAAHPHSPPR